MTEKGQPPEQTIDFEVMIMRYVIPTVLASLPVLLTSKAFADPRSDPICLLAGHAGSSFGTAGILGLLAASAIGLGVWLYRRRDRIDSSAAADRSQNVNV
jgi:hypothetical protein